MKNLLRVVTIAIVLLAVGSVTAAWLRKSEKSYPSKAVRIISLESRVNPDGSSTIRSVQIRWVAEDGAWKLVKLNPDGRAGVAMYSDREGVFTEGKDGALRKIASRDKLDAHAEYRSATALRSSKQFVREDQVCGYRAFVLRSEEPGQYTEVWYSPEVGAIPLKVVMHVEEQPDIVDEALKVDFVSVAASEIKRPERPVIESPVNQKK